MGHTSPGATTGAVAAAAPTKASSVPLFDPPLTSPHGSLVKGAPLLELVVANLLVECPSSTPATGAPLLELLATDVPVERAHPSPALAATVGADPTPPL
jgi:hypothetical protein